MLTITAYKWLSLILNDKVKCDLVGVRNNTTHQKFIDTYHRHREIELFYISKNYIQKKYSLFLFPV